MLGKNSGLSWCLAFVLAGFSVNGLAAEIKTGKDKKKATTMVIVTPEKESIGGIAGTSEAGESNNDSTGSKGAVAKSNNKMAPRRPLTAEEYQEARAEAFRRNGNNYNTPFFK